VNDAGNTVSRRLLGLGGLAALAFSDAALPRTGGNAPPERLPDLALPANNLQALVRTVASLREEDVPWWYDGTVYGVEPGVNPRPLFKFEGMEIYWMRHLPAGDFELTGNTVSFFRDLDTGAWLDQFANPYTGASNTPVPAVQGGGPGRGFNYSVNGIRFTRVMDQLPAKPLIMDWTFVRDMVWLHADTVYPPGMAPPRAQRQTMFVSQKDFRNARLQRLPTVFSSTVHMPWLRWMAMGDRPGHLVWHASGAKLRSVADLPREYRQRVEQSHPQMLTADPARAAERVLPPAG
jgi:hypothetical protein